MNYCDDSHATIATGITAEMMSFNDFVSRFKPSGWVGPIEEFVSLHWINEEEYILLKNTNTISSIPEFIGKFYYKEAVEAFFKKEYKD